jgi:acyl carrier protein phosphodiesterase
LPRADDGLNFLAHLLLSDDKSDAHVGNVLADFVKGRDAVEQLPPGVRAGVAQHRAVDAFTDRHPAVQRSITRVSKDWGWFSGILIDVYYDHLLARDWPAFCDEPLRSFADRMYVSLSAGAPLFGPARPFLDAFLADDRLTRYATTDGVRDTLARLSRRIAERMPTRAVRLEDAIPVLSAADAGLATDFRAFWPEVRAYSRRLPKHDTDYRPETAPSS